MFINFSNHRFDMWSREQLFEAEKYGTLFDLPFPLLDPKNSVDDIVSLGKKYASQILSVLNDSEEKKHAVLCQGEHSLSYVVTKILREHDVNVVTACSERVSIETMNEKKETEKKSVFRFVCFRSYM